MGYSIKLSKSTLKDLKNLKAAHLDKKFIELTEVLRINPLQTPPPYEKLIGDLDGKYSRRLNIQHRLVYSVNEEAKEVIIWSTWSHYER